MASCSGPVPSKNALRALRSLAFGTPGLVVGAVGGVCGLAGVQYEIRRKIRLAQDIVDTKRTLASFASGRGKDRVRQMLEAAENGDDFLIDRHRSPRQRQRRDHSTTTLVHAHDDDAVLMLRAARSRDKRSHIGSSGSSYEHILLVEPDAAHKTTSTSSSAFSPYTQKDPQAQRSMDVQHRTPQPRVQHFESTTLPRPFTSHSSRPIVQCHGSDAPDTASLHLPLLNTGQSSSNDRGHRSSTSGHSWRRCYARDLENSPAERIRRATIKSMKPIGHSVHSQRHHASTAHSPSSVNSPRLASLDLAPRYETEIMSAPREDRPADDVFISADSHKNTFTNWPGPCQGSLGADIFTTNSCSATSANGGSPETDLLPPNANISYVFTSSFIAIDQELSSDHLLAATRVLPAGFATGPKGGTLAKGASDGFTTYRQNSALRENNMDPALYMWWLETHPLEVDGFRGWVKALRSLRVLESNMASLERSLLRITRIWGNKLLAKRILSAIRKRTQDTQKHQAEPLHTKGQVDVQGQSAFSRSPHFHTFVVPPPSAGLKAITHLSEALANVDYDRYAHFCTDIGNHPSRLTRELALSSRMEELVSAGTPTDRQLAELLFHTFFKPFQGPSPFRRISIPAIRLAASLLGDGHCERAATLLFPYDDQDLVVLKDSSRETKARMLYGSAHDFLTWYGGSTDDLDKLDQATRQTLEAATSRGIKLANLPVGYLLAPVIRSLCARGHEERAHNLLKDVQFQYGIAFSDTLDARAKLIIGYANSNSLVPLKLMLDECHANAVSRQQPAWYSRLFQQVFQRHLRCNSLAESYDLLVHAMAYWGLMPTQTVSSILLSECLRYERYDLIREYVQAVRELYSFIDLGTGTSLLAWRFGRVWKDMQASCEQILKGCQALAYCATDDPFGKHLRDVVEEASRLNITTRLSALLHASGRSANVHQLLKLSFPDIIEWAQILVLGPSTQTAAFLEAREQLLTQLGALNNLNQLLGGLDPTEQPEHSPRRNSTLTKRPSSRRDGDDGGYSLRIFQTPNILPDRDTLWRYLAMHYAHRKRKGLPANHDLLRHVCQELTRLQRSAEAAELFAAVHESPYGSDAKGTPFDENVLQAWLDAATALDSPLVATKVLWVILDADHDVIISTPLLLQAEHACVRILDPLIAKRQARNPLSFQREAAYLQPALRRRYQRQSGIKSHEERLMWNGYKSWDESTVDMPLNEEQDGQVFDSLPFSNGHVGSATEFPKSVHAY
ncbi:hypothetical protein DV736_g1736, partial [Chaetothyriales sp. CBS 134916]